MFAGAVLLNGQLSVLKYKQKEENTEETKEVSVMSWLFEDDKNNSDYDYKRLRKDLENEYAIQSATFSGGFGFCQMLDVSNASEAELLKMAKKEGLNLNRYKR